MHDDALLDLDQVADGAAFQLSDTLTAFRVPKHSFRKGNTYALSRPEGVILVDAVHKVTAMALNQHLAGRKVLALLLTHRDLLTQSFGPPALLRHCFGGAPVLIHKADAMQPGLIKLEDAAELLAQLGVQYYPIPGHTPGSVVYRTVPEQLLFVGDAAVGRPYGSDPQTIDFSHPPIAAQDWEAYVAGWASIPEPAAAVLPLHGRPVFGDKSLVRARTAATTQGNQMN